MALTTELGRRPLRRVLGTFPYVVFRTPEGSVGVLEDRCPHRNVPLSDGRCVGETIECPYHGWRFGSDGTCRHIPALHAQPKAGHRARSLPVVVLGGIVFAGWGVGPDSAPSLPGGDGAEKEGGSRKETTLLRCVHYAGSLFSVVENALDVPHTSILHRGLFRGGERQRILVEVRRYRTRVEAEYLGEAPPRGLMARLLSGFRHGEVSVSHFDRFLLPNLLQVEYRLGEHARLLVSGFCRPISDYETALYAHVLVRTPLPRWLERLALRVVEPFAHLVVRQDQRVLRAQSETLRTFGEARPMSTDLDVLHSGVVRLLKEAETRLDDETVSEAADLPEEERTIEMLA